MAKYDPGQSGTGTPHPDTPGNVSPGSPGSGALPIPPPTPPGQPPTLPPMPPSLAPQVTRSPEQWEQFWAQASGTRAKSSQFDQWLLSGGAQLSPDAGPDQIQALTALKAAAQKRQSLRASFPNPNPLEETEIEAGKTPPPRLPTQTSDSALADALRKKAQNDVANKRAQNEDATRGKPHGISPLVVDQYGNPKGGSGGTQANPQSLTAVLGGGAPSSSIPGSGTNVYNGKYVWVGGGPDVNDTAQWARDKDGNLIKDKNGNFVKVMPQGNTVTATDKFMTSDDAKASVYGMDPKQVAKLQKMYNLPVTGVVDKRTFDLWSWGVDAAAGYTAAGQKITPYDLLSINAARGGSGRGGGGGGGGGGAKFKMSDVQALLTSVTQKELGRDPTQAEVSSFFSYFNGLAGGDTADPSQIATNWVRLHAGPEAGSYQAATNYYQAMLSILGASGLGGSGG